MLMQELGGFQRSSASVEGWLALQQHVEGFSLNARRVARRLAHFVGMLNQGGNYQSRSMHAYCRYFQSM